MLQVGWKHVQLVLQEVKEKIELSGQQDTEVNKKHWRGDTLHMYCVHLSQAIPTDLYCRNTIP